MVTAGIVFGLVISVALLTLWRGRRREHVPRSRGSASGMMRAGMLEVQSFLQPERKIEILAKGEFDEKDDEVPSGPPQAGK